MGDRLVFLLRRLGEHLWVRPLITCLLSIAAAFLARRADHTGADSLLPEISSESIETLLTTISASMLVIATFAVGSMVSAYASASRTATPRAFPLVVADDVSQNALSTFIGAFIFSIVALIALKNGYYAKSGHFTLFALTLVVFVTVILVFVRWTDRIARLGRLGETIRRVEAATAAALRQRRRTPHLRGVAPGPHRLESRPVHGETIGYVQRVDVAALQRYAVASHVRIAVTALPGTFAAPDRALAHVTADSGDPADLDTGPVVRAFLIADDRAFDEDPRFGLVVLSEIASRALSPAVNDPGTAIDILGSFVRLLAPWMASGTDADEEAPECDRVEVPGLSVADLFDDAFMAIARDGGGMVEVVGRLQKALASLASVGDAATQAIAVHHARLSLARAERRLDLPEDRAVVRRLAERVPAA